MFTTAPEEWHRSGTVSRLRTAGGFPQEKATTPSPPHPTDGAAYPSILFSPPGYGFSTLDAHWKPLI